jgi:hypothetical protein
MRFNSYAAKTYCEPSGLELPEPIASECGLKLWRRYNCRSSMFAGMLAAAAAMSICQDLPPIAPTRREQGIKNPIKLPYGFNHQLHAKTRLPWKSCRHQSPLGSRNPLLSSNPLFLLE